MVKLVSYVCPALFFCINGTIEVTKAWKRLCDQFTFVLENGISVSEPSSKKRKAFSCSHDLTCIQGLLNIE